MSGFDPFESASDDTHGQMMRATYDALRKHGYSDLTIQRIGDEFPKSKSLIYQHYDGKDDLLVALLEFLLEQLTEAIPTDGPEGCDDAREHLQLIIEHSLPADLEPEHADFMGALESLRGQAPHDDTYRDRFATIDEFHRDHTADVIRDGIDQGVFREVDPDRVAGFIVATIHGARNQRATTGSHEPVRAARRELEEYVRTRLAADAEDR